MKLHMENEVACRTLHIWTTLVRQEKEALTNQGFAMQAWLLLWDFQASVGVMNVTINRDCVASGTVALIVCLKDKG